jgi:hypothetical protein
MANLETIRVWEELREEMEMLARATATLADNVWPGPPPEKASLQAPWWWFAGLNHDPTEPEPRESLIQSTIIWELAFEAIRKNELSETSKTLLAIKESGVLEEVLNEQAQKLERAAESLRMKSRSMARKLRTRCNHEQFGLTDSRTLRAREVRSTRRVVPGRRRRGRIAEGGEGTRDPKPAEATCRAHPTRPQAIRGGSGEARTAAWQRVRGKAAPGAGRTGATTAVAKERVRPAAGASGRIHERHATHPYVNL